MSLFDLTTSTVSRCDNFCRRCWRDHNLFAWRKPRYVCFVILRAELIAWRALFWIARVCLPTDSQNSLRTCILCTSAIVCSDLYTSLILVCRHFQIYSKWSQSRVLRSWGQGQGHTTKYTHADGLRSIERRSCLTQNSTAPPWGMKN